VQVQAVRGARKALLAVAGAVLLASLMPASRSAATEGRRVLFIGNSYTRFNDLPRMVREIARSVPDGPSLRTRRETHGGYRLRGHWRQRRVRRLVAGGRFDVIVIQAHSLSPLERPDEMEEYARRFAERARAAGSEVVLFQTWARHPESPTLDELQLDPAEMHQRVDGVYASLATRLGARLAPVGRAWLRAQTEVPDARLYRPDRTHPTMTGTYLSACVMYRTLTGVDPRRATWKPWRMRPEEAERLRAVAASIE